MCDQSRITNSNYEHKFRSLFEFACVRLDLQNMGDGAYMTLRSLHPRNCVPYMYGHAVMYIHTDAQV